MIFMDLLMKSDFELAVFHDLPARPTHFCSYRSTEHCSLLVCFIVEMVTSFFFFFQKKKKKERDGDFLLAHMNEPK